MGGGSWIYFAVRGVEVGSNSNINCGRPTWMPMHSLAAASSLDDDDIWIRRLFHLFLARPTLRVSERRVRTYGRSFVRVSL